MKKTVKDGTELFTRFANNKPTNPDAKRDPKILAGEAIHTHFAKKNADPFTGRASEKEN